jgi:hypothetical protein
MASFFYALIREITFRTKRKSKERIEIIESIFNRISKAPIIFLYIIQIFGKGNTIFEFILKLFFKIVFLMAAIQPIRL